MTGAYFDTAGNQFRPAGSENVDCTINGRSVTIKWSALGGGNPGQWFYDESGFGVIVDICGELCFAKFSYDGRRIYEKRFGQHAHSWGILAPRSRRLCVIEFQHGKGVGMMVHVFDWNTGKQLKMVIVREHEADVMAIDKNERYLYIGKRGSSAQRAEL